MITILITSISTFIFVNLLYYYNNKQKYIYKKSVERMILNLEKQINNCNQIPSKDVSYVLEHIKILINL